MAVGQDKAPAESSVERTPTCGTLVALTMATTIEQEALRHLANLRVNQQNIELLFRYSEALVPFIGAGLSRDFGYPAWHTLLEGLAETAGLSEATRNLLAADKFEEAAELIYNALPNQFDDTLRIEFSASTLERPLRPYAIRHVPMIGRGVVLTTNFDCVLEAAYEEALRPFQRVFSGAHIREASRAVQLNERCLLKLHGDYQDSENRILTLAEYERQYGRGTPGTIDMNLPLPTVLGQALTSRPLLFLGCSLKTDRTLGVISSLAKRYEGTIHFALLSSEEAVPPRQQQLDRWNIRPLFFPAGQFNEIDGFLQCLAQHCQNRSANYLALDIVDPPSGKSQGPHRLTSNALRQRTSEARRLDPKPLRKVRINGYKMFYFRRTRRFGKKALAKLAGVQDRDIRRLETIRVNPGPLTSDCFAACNPDMLKRIENALDCSGKLMAGQADDFLTMYMLYYKLYCGTANTAKGDDDQLDFPFETKVVVFDFDGTLTARTDDETTWEKIWVKLGYSINDCSDLHSKYWNGKFSHQKWCDITRDHFKNARLSKKDLHMVAESIRLIDGTREALDTLRERGVKIYILSGSIRQIIYEVLGELRNLFEDIRANDIIFDYSGIIREIRGTPFDFEGKATFLSRIIEEGGYSPEDVLFIGNSCNDIFASRSGARTLCVNPQGTEWNNKEHWTYLLRRMDNLTDILRFVNV